MPARFRRTIPCLLGLFALVGAGCGRGPALAEVSGTVRLNGKPMPKALVEFVPDSATGTTGPSSMGFSDERGQYSLTTSGHAAGVVVGTHRVVVIDLISYPTNPGDERGVEKVMGKPRIPDHYRDVFQTPLRKEVKAGVPQTIDLDVTANR